MSKNGHLFIFNYKMLFTFFLSNIAFLYIIHRKITYKIKNVSNKFNYFFLTNLIIF
jgi:hypothetical protein